MPDVATVFIQDKDPQEVVKPCHEAQVPHYTMPTTRIGDQGSHFATGLSLDLVKVLFSFLSLPYSYNFKV